MKSVRRKISNNRKSMRLRRNQRRVQKQLRRHKGGMNPQKVTTKINERQPQISGLVNRARQCIMKNDSNVMFETSLRAGSLVTINKELPIHTNIELIMNNIINVLNSNYTVLTEPTEDNYNALMINYDKLSMGPGNLFSNFCIP